MGRIVIIFRYSVTIETVSRVMHVLFGRWGVSMLVLCVALLTSTGCRMTDSMRNKELLGLWRSTPNKTEVGLIQVELEFQSGNRLVTTLVNYTDGDTERHSQEGDYSIHASEITCDEIWREPKRYKFDRGNLVMLEEPAGEMKLQRVKSVPLSNVIGEWVGKISDEEESFNISITLQHNGKVVSHFWPESQDKSKSHVTNGTFEFHIDRVTLNGIYGPKEYLVKGNQLISPNPLGPKYCLTRQR